MRVGQPADQQRTAWSALERLTTSWCSEFKKDFKKHLILQRHWNVQSGVWENVTGSLIHPDLCIQESFTNTSMCVHLVAVPHIHQIHIALCPVQMFMKYCCTHRLCHAVMQPCISTPFQWHLKRAVTFIHLYIDLCSPIHKLYQICWNTHQMRGPQGYKRKQHQVLSSHYTYFSEPIAICKRGMIQHAHTRDQGLIHQIKLVADLCSHCTCVLNCVHCTTYSAGCIEVYMMHR